MTKTRWGYGLALFLAAALAQPATHAQSSTSGATAQAPPRAGSLAGTPTYGQFGLDLTGMDRSVNPGDSFYGYVNGGWDKATEIPADRSNWGTFTILADQAEQHVHELVEDAARQSAGRTAAAQRVGDYFAAFMDEVAIEKQGVAPIKPVLDFIASIGTRADLSRAMGLANRIGVNVPVRIDVDVDLKTNDRYAVYLRQGGLGLPDRDYYLDDSNPRFVDARTKYEQHIAAMLKLTGAVQTEARARAIVALETKMAAAHWSRVESRQVEKLYNPVTRAELTTTFPGIDWNAFSGGASIPGQAPLVVMQPSALEQLSTLVATEPLATLRDYAIFRVIDAYASVLPTAFVDEDFAFNGRVLTGTTAMRERWRRAVNQLNNGLGEAVGQLYVAKYFPPESKAKADDLVRNVIAAMDVRLENLAWMAPETKEKARAKLKAFTPKIAYPDKWRDYSSLSISRTDAFGNLRRAREFEYQRNMDKIGKAVDRGEWGMTPQTVNAYANPSLNGIVFPAAILQPPFFDPNADAAVNYGGIGMVIGHELSHHFDDQGRKFDPQGRLGDWWTPADVERFKTYTDRVVRQDPPYEPLPGSRVNGELTLGENMADLAGLMVAYDAYHLSLKGQPPAVIDGLSGDQRFFLGFAQVWRRKYRDEALLRLLTTDSHTPGNYRPNVVRNVDAWYAAFNIQPGQTLYLTPEQRIRVW